MIIDLRSGRIRLRPCRLDDLDALLAADGDPRPQDRERLRQRIERPPALDADGLLELTVEWDPDPMLPTARGVGPRPVGSIQARAPRHGFPPGVCELGVALLPEVRGQGVGRIAVDLFAGFLLADGWARVQATTAVTNTAMRRVLERSGFAFEGVATDYLPAPSDGSRDPGFGSVVGPGRVDAAVYARCRAAGISRSTAPG